MDLTGPFLDTLCRAVRAALGCTQAVVRVDDTVIPLTGLFVDDTRHAPGAVPDEFSGARFVAAVPVLRGDEPRATLWVADAEPRAVTAELRGLLADFGLLAAQYLSLAADAALHRLVAENSADTLIRGDMDGVRRYVSPSIRTLLGYEAHELVGKRASDITHPDDAEGFARKMIAMRDGHVDSFTTEHRMRHRDGGWVWIEAFVRVTRDTTTGARDGYVVSVRDTSHRKELESRLAHNASHDVLTGLPNRALLDERLAEQIARGGDFAVLCVDLDGFKQVNDALGHSVGDTVLTAVAERLVSCVRATDTVARRSGDEFVIILTDTPLPDSATTLASRLIDSASAPMTIGQWTGTVGLSIGIAVGGPTSSGEELLLAADRAMYEAKAAGHNGYRLAAD